MKKIYIATLKNLQKYAKSTALSRELQLKQNW